MLRLTSGSCECPVQDAGMTAAADKGFPTDSTLVDHPIPLEHVDAAFALAERFFDLPMETKQKTP